MRIRPLPFRQSDISRALKGARDAGFEVGRLEIAQDGRIVILPKSVADPGLIPLDKWEAEYRARQT